MNDFIYLIGMMALSSVFAFLKLFNKTGDYMNFIILGIVFSVLEFIGRISTVQTGLKALGLTVIFLQILWISMNFISSSVLGMYFYGEKIDTNDILGMLLIVGGIYICGKKFIK